MRSFLFMQVSKEAIEEFQQLYLRKEGKKLSSKEALEIITNLLLAFEVVYRPIPKKDKRQFKNRKAANPQRFERSGPLNNNRGLPFLKI